MTVILFDFDGAPGGGFTHERGELPVSSLEEAEELRVAIVPNGWGDVVNTDGEVVQVLREGTENYQC